MRTEEFKGHDVRTVLAALATDDATLSRIAPLFRPGLFPSRAAELIASWCVRYHHQYAQAPRRHLEASYRDWASRTKDHALAELVASLLSSISQEFESRTTNTEWAVDQAQRLFERTRLEQTAEKIKLALERGDLEAAEKARSESQQVRVGSQSWIDLFDCESVIEAAFESSLRPPLIPYDGALGEFFSHRDCLHPDCFVAVLGQKGAGKSWVLMDMAWRALLARQKVAFFSVGDMSQLQFLMRLLVRATGTPSQPGIYNYPTRCGGADDPHGTKWDALTFSRGIGPQNALGALRELGGRMGLQNHFRLSCHPSRSITALQIESIVENWAKEGFVASTVVLDYADLLAPIDGKDEHRDSINKTWIHLRSLSQKTHTLLITATQADAQSYHAHLLTRSNFSDDRRKIDHVNAMLGLNATAEERKNQIVRLNWLAVREGEYDERKCCYAAGQRALAEPLVVSSW